MGENTAQKVCLNQFVPGKGQGRICPGSGFRKPDPAKAIGKGTRLVRVFLKRDGIDLSGLGQIAVVSGNRDRIAQGFSGRDSKLEFDTEKLVQTKLVLAEVIAGTAVRAAERLWCAEAQKRLGIIRRGVAAEGELELLNCFPAQQINPLRPIQPGSIPAARLP